MHGPLGPGPAPKSARAMGPASAGNLPYAQGGTRCFIGVPGDLTGCTGSGIAFTCFLSVFTDPSTASCGHGHACLELGIKWVERPNNHGHPMTRRMPKSLDKHQMAGQTYIYTYIHTYTHTYMYVCMGHWARAQPQKARGPWARPARFLGLGPGPMAHTYIHACMHVCMYVCMHVCMYV